jgi:excisionase family DNA binding protein
MISTVATVAAKGTKKGAASSHLKSADPVKPSRVRGGWHGRERLGSSPHFPRESPDGLEEQLGDQAIFSVKELADLANRSAPTIFRLLRLGQLSFVQVGGSRCFTRAIVLDFLRHGTRKSGAPAA